MKNVIKILVSVVLIATIACVLFACVPSNMDKAKEKMEKAGFTVVSITRDYEGLQGAFSATKVSISEGSGTMLAFYFDSSASAKDALENIKGEEDKDDDDTVKQSGKWVYMGTSAAISAFEG